MNRLYLVRHAENWANLTKEFSCKFVDYSLTPKGILQAQQTAEYFSSIHIDAIYSSPLKRTRETADIIGARTGHTSITIENFREVNVGDLERLPPTAENWTIHNQVIAHWFSGEPDISFPGGESQVALVERFKEGLRRVTEGKNNSSILIIAHGGIITFGLPDICKDITFAVIKSTGNHNCAITELLLQTDGTCELIRYGDHSHLYDEAALLVPGVPDAEYFRVNRKE